MEIDLKIVVEKLKDIFRLKDSPIAFFYTDNPPAEIYKPKQKSIEHVPCIIQLLNGVRNGNILVLGKQSRNLCPGGLAYLGFKKIFPGANYFLSTGIKNIKDDKGIEGERIFKTPQLAEEFYKEIPFKKNPAKYAVFMPLEAVNLSEYHPLLVIFFVNPDQLTGFIQLANYDTKNRTILGIGSGCSTIITEPLAELKKMNPPRAVVGMLTDVLARRHIKSSEISFTIGFNRLIQLYENIDESFLKLKAWNNIHKRIR
ncbi:MAG: DUF169 domain-containing protein [Candidatus Helarchaeota archaeon]